MNTDVLKSALPVLLVTAVMCGSASSSLLPNMKDMSFDEDMLLPKACELFTLNVFEQLTAAVNPVLGRIQITGLIGQSVGRKNLIEETASICIYYFEPEEWGITLNRPNRRELLFSMNYPGHDKYWRIASVPAKIYGRRVFCW